MSFNSLYTDLSGYYDLMCADIDYREQCAFVHRVNQLLGNGGDRYLDLACGTGPHVRHFQALGYRASGLDINQPMLDIAQQRCPQALFTQQDMCDFTVTEPQDLITCFLYSIHYNATLEKLQLCFQRVHAALKSGGVFCFNAVDKNTLPASKAIRHSTQHDGSAFVFQSGWRYPGEGDNQSLLVRIEKTTDGAQQVWQDEHPMVALTFVALQTMLDELFEVQVLAHDYGRITPWDGEAGNGVFVCLKR